MVVKIVNPKQASLYIKNGLECLRCYWGNNCVVYEFDKYKSKPLFYKWINHELK